MTWQGDTTHGWYGMRFNVEVEPHDHQYLLAMYKLACYINERAIEKSPIEVLGIIGADEHVSDYGMYIPITDNGKYVYDVKRQGESCTYTRITAINEVMAFRIIDGLIRRKEIPNEPYTIKASPARITYTPTNLGIATTRDLSTKQ
jgi:hypothetical protein